MHQSIDHQQRADGVHIISFHSQLQDSSGQQAVRDFFGHDFLHCTADGHSVVVDLANVNTLDSASLGPLVQRLRDLQDRRGRLILCGLKAPALREIFALTRFDQIFEIVPTVDEALARLHSSATAAEEDAASAEDDLDDWPG